MGDGLLSQYVMIYEMDAYVCLQDYSAGGALDTVMSSVLLSYLIQRNKEVQSQG